MEQEQVKEVKQEEEVKVVEWVFQGQRVSTKEKRLYAWARKDEPDTTMHYDKPLTPASVGGVYLFHEQGGSFYTRGEHAPKYIGRFEDADKIKTWAIKDEQARQDLARKSLNTKASKVSPLDDALEDIKAMSRRLNNAERLALISKVAEVILSAR